MNISLTIIALLLLLALTALQIALLFGAPLGKFAWGGQHVRLPANLRISSAFSIILYVMFAVFLMSKSGLLVLITDTSILNLGMWLFTVYFFLGIVMNAISRSTLERHTMTPVVAALATVFLIVTVSS